MAEPAPCGGGGGGANTTRHPPLACSPAACSKCGGKEAGAAARAADIAAPLTPGMPVKKGTGGVDNCSAGSGLSCAEPGHAGVWLRTRRSQPGSCGLLGETRRLLMSRMDHGEEMNGSDLEDVHETVGSSEAGLDMLLRQLHEEHRPQPEAIQAQLSQAPHRRAHEGHRVQRLPAIPPVVEAGPRGKQAPDQRPDHKRDRVLPRPGRFRGDKEKGHPATGTLYKERTGTFSLRAWSAGCATGEEPYSLSILFQEALAREEEPQTWTVRITATDLDDKALRKAAGGQSTRRSRCRPA